MTNSGPSASREELEWADIAAMLKSQRLAISLTVVLATTAAILYAYLATEMFRAQVVVRPADSESAGAGAEIISQLGGLASMAGVSLPGGAAANDAFATLDSTSIAEQFVVMNELEPVLRRREGDAASVRKAVRRLKNDILRVTEDRRTGLITVAVVWEDPAVAAEWANGIVALANESLRARDKENAERNLAYLTSELDRTPVVEMQRVLYQLIERETQTLMLVDARREYALRVLDRAYAPEWRDSPRRLQTILVGIVAGLVLGVILGVIRAARSQTS